MAVANKAAVHFEARYDMDEDIRLDKSLWAAHFFKIRSLAAQAASGGKVEISGGLLSRAA